MNQLSAINAVSSAGIESHSGIENPPKAGTTETERKKLEAAAREFEALFLGLMLKEMRATVGASDLGETGMGQSTYTEMFDQEVARSLSERGSLGIANLLLRNLQNRAPAAEMGDSELSAEPEKSLCPKTP